MDSDYVPDEKEQDEIPSEEGSDDYENDDDDVASEESWNDGDSKKKPKKKKTTKSISKKTPKQIAKKITAKNSRKGSRMSTSSLSPEYVADIKQTFERFDTEKKGRFDIKQLKFAMRALGFEPKKEEVKRITDEYNKDGYILYDDFMDLMVKRITEKTVNDEIMKAFELFDTNQTGKITFEDLKRVSNELGEKITDEELTEMIEEADLDGDKAVDCQEFLRIMKKTCLY